VVGILTLSNTSKTEGREEQTKGGGKQDGELASQQSRTIKKTL
jgi:hypothetical protein